MFLPFRNEGDLRDVTPDVRNALKFHFIKDVNEVLQLAGLGPLPPSYVPTPERDRVALSN